MKKSSKNKKKDTKNKELESTEIVRNTLSAEDELVEKITKRVIAETMKTIRPLLEKLQEVAGPEGQQQIQQKPGLVPNNQNVSYEEQLKKIQSMASDRMSLLEQKVATKMKKRQMKISRYK